MSHTRHLRLISMWLRVYWHQVSNIGKKLTKKFEPEFRPNFPIFQANQKISTTLLPGKNIYQPRIFGLILANSQILLKIGEIWLINPKNPELYKKNCCRGFARMNHKNYRILGVYFSVYTKKTRTPFLCRVKASVENLAP